MLTTTIVLVFVQTNPIIPLDKVLGPVSAVRGRQHYSNLQMINQPRTGCFGMEKVVEKFRVLAKQTIHQSER
ncbi:hypothetical protein NC652_014353 [Populus alba x Populus x berolinensis]|nr:hypothetical protein NC652_014353 [Populus alba x Populus x berolinensis]